MRKLVASYVEGVRDAAHGESFNRIMRYFIPEIITAFLLYSLPVLLDSYFIAHLKATAAYGALSGTNTLFHFFTKIAEAISVGTLVAVGNYNGRSEYKDVGRVLRDSFWTTCLLGLAVSVFIFAGAYWIALWLVPLEMVPMAVLFLRLRSISVLLMFIFLAFVGFLRGIKNVKMPMHVFIVGTATFVFFDYALIFGKYGMPEMGVQGSAMASIIQYAVMAAFVAGYVVFNEKYRKFGIEMWSILADKSHIRDLLRLSWPMILDKATMAFAYMWLCAMMKPLGSSGFASFCVIKDMERVALLPAIAFAQVITVLVSNDFGIRNWLGIKANIKKIIALASLMVFIIMTTFALNAEYLISCFFRNLTGDSVSLAARVFPILSVLAFFDLLQLVLSGALRGSANVRLVMVARFVVCLCYFVPVSYIISQLPIDDVALKLVLIYGSFYVGNAFISIAYINRFRGEDWKVLR